MIIMFTTEATCFQIIVLGIIYFLARDAPRE